MRLTDWVPDSLRPLLRPLYYRTRALVQRNITRRPKAKAVLHQYWRQPWDGKNLPESYLNPATAPRSQFLVTLVKKHVAPNARILEIGCGVGRNLNYLFGEGFSELEGVEISEKAVEMLGKSYPVMAEHVKIHNAALEDVITQFEAGEFDLIYTMAALAFIHKDSEWTFKEIVRIARNLLITIEDERGISWRHFPRNYKSIFESLGMKQTEETNCSGVNGLGASYIARIFKKEYDP
jgi:SAM-dependent methyltransferase